MRRTSLALLFGSEIFGGSIGLVVMIILARRLGPAGFADFEYASAVAAWLLVVVRGGFDTIVYREAARRPRLIRKFSDVLIGLRLVSSVASLLAVFLLASTSSPDRGLVIAVGGLILIPAAFASDVGIRAFCRFGGLALAQTIRSLILVLAVGLLVSGASDAAIALGCVVIAEVASTIVLSIIHKSEYGWVRPRFRRRVWKVVAKRGAITGASRFVRVSLYSVDILILGYLAAPSELGPYAAARRLVFALLAVGMILPSSIGPGFAKAWCQGADVARSSIATTFERFSMVVLPMTIGLIFTAGRSMPWLFGESFVDGGPWLGIIAARLPFVLGSNLQNSALIACRRESWSFGLTIGMVILGLFLIPLLAMLKGTWGVSWGVLLVEASGTFAGWVALARLGIAPRWHHASGPTLLGCVALILVGLLAQEWPLALTVVVGAGVYGIVILIAGQCRGVTVPMALIKPISVVPGGPSS